MANMPPVVSQPVPDMYYRANGYFVRQIPPSTFSDPDSSLTYSATLEGGAPLPDWLSFNPATLTFEGTPPRAHIGMPSFSLQVTASDGEFVASDIFAVSDDGLWLVVLSLGPENNTFDWGDGGFIVLGGGGDDTLIGGRGNDDVFGGEGNDIINGGAGHNILGGDDGNDFITGIGNLSEGYGGTGDDQLFFVGNQNQLYGGDGNDWLGVCGNNNALVGSAGDDWIGATGSSNTLNGQDGDDALFAYGAGNYLYGSTGNDWIGVSGDNNFLNGAQGNDYIAATGNCNTLDGGAGNDQLVAGAHAGDRFVFHPGYGIDSITGFAPHGGGGDAGGTDVIDLNGFGLNFTTLQPFLSNVGGNAVITINAATVLTIIGVTSAQLQASDFLF